MATQRHWWRSSGAFKGALREIEARQWRASASICISAFNDLWDSLRPLHGRPGRGAESKYPQLHQVHPWRLEHRVRSFGSKDADKSRPRGLEGQAVTPRKPSTVNQMLMKLSAVLNSLVENGHLEKSCDKKLKFTKGIESTGKAFTQEQVGKLMEYSKKLPETS